MDQTIEVIFGAGPVGLALAEELANKGRKVRIVSRNRPTEFPKGVEWFQADLSHAEQSFAASQNGRVIYHAANAPYQLWPELLPVLWKNIANAAQRRDIPLVVADNLYSYGESAIPLSENLPETATTRKGQARIKAANALRHSPNWKKTAILRASDFFGPQVRVASLGERVFPPILSGKSISMFGDPTLPHSSVYIKDLARALVLLADDPHSWGQIWHMPPLESESFLSVLSEAGRQVGKPVKVTKFGRLAISLLSPIIPILKEIKEMLYQFEKPFVTNADRFRKAYHFVPTPLDQAVRETLAWYSNESNIERGSGRA